MVVLAEEEYARLLRSALAGAPGFVAQLLSMPRDDGGFDGLSRII